jgi:Tol biopolymer transport system component
MWDSQSTVTVYSKSTAAIGGIGVSPDGNRIVYSLSSLLYAVDRAANSSWTIGAVASGSHVGLRISGNSRFLVYAAPLNGTNQVYFYDLQAKTNLLVSHNYASGGAAFGASDSPDISSDGRFISFRSTAGNLVPGDTNGLPDVFLYDRQTGIMTLLSANRFSNGPGDNRSLAPAFSADGRTVVFQSWATDLVAQDFNGSCDVYACSLYTSGQMPLFYATIVRATGSGQTPWIMWPAVAGRSYRVQYKNRLSDSNWQEFSGNVTILGDQGYFNDLLSGAGPRFYRVVAY